MKYIIIGIYMYPSTFTGQAPEASLDILKNSNIRNNKVLLTDMTQFRLSRLLKLFLVKVFNRWINDISIILNAFQIIDRHHKYYKLRHNNLFQS